MLPNTDVAGAIRVAEKVRTDLRSRQLAPVGSQVSDCVTLSLGVSSVIPAADTGPTVLAKTADSGLYAAKQQGRNRVVLARGAAGGEPAPNHSPL